MWTKVEIQAKTYLSEYKVSGNITYYYFTDLKHLWKEELSEQDVLTRVKGLNRRIEYERDVVLKALESKPDLMDFEKESELGMKNLKVKYYISGRPFYFKWQLKFCSQDEFLQIVTNPLLLSVCTLAKQNEELVEIIKKKDIEIEQYKQEGAVLKRVKVATKPFVKEHFEAQYPRLINGGFTKYACDNFLALKNACIDLIEAEQISTVDPERSPGKSGETKQVHKSPRNARNQFREKIRAIKQQIYDSKLDYDSDTDTNSDIDEDTITDIKKKLDELNQKRREDLKQREERENVKKTKKKLNL